LRHVLSSRVLRVLLAGLVAAGLASCGRRGPLEPPEGSASAAAVPRTVSEVPPQVATPSAGLATEPLGPAYQTGVPNQTVLPGTGRSSFPLDPLL
jgi:predicted small lipoprotein YifL